MAHENHPAVIDLAVSTLPILDELKERNIQTVFRYLSDEQPDVGLPEKILRSEEANALLENWFSIGLVWQWYNNRFSSMTRERGEADASRALTQAADLDVPSGATIYFGVDGDWWRDSSQRKVIEYFEGIQSVWSRDSADFGVGVYGSGTTCKNLRGEGLANFFWLPLSTGWSGTPAFFNSGGYHFYQNFHGLRINGRYTDTNILRDDSIDIGTFNREGIVSANQPAVIRETRRFVEASRLNVWSGPSSSHDVIDELRYRKNVIALANHGAWTEVTYGEDRIHHGFCFSEHLSLFESMP